MKRFLKFLRFVQFSETPIRVFIFGCLGLLMAACATTPLPPLQTFPPSHPASPQAQEGSVRPFQNSLAPDEATQKSTALLNQSKIENKARDSTPSSDMSNMPGMNMKGGHENH